MTTGSFPNLSRKTIHTWIYFVCLCLLATSLTTSRFMISVSQILLLINWLAEGDFKNKYKKFISNKPAIAFILIYGIYVVGLLWTEDLSYGINFDLKIKLPILLLTIVISTSPSLDLKKVRIILYVFIAAVLAVSIISYLTYLITDPIRYRDMLTILSHLDYSIMLVFAIFLLPALTLQTTKNKYWIALSFILSAWMLLFLVLLRSLTGVASFAGVLTFLLLVFVVKNKSMVLRTAVISLFVVSIAFTVGLMVYMYNMTNREVEKDFSKLGQYTKYGNYYYHDTTNLIRENGHLVFIYVAEEELEEAWNNRSDILYFDKDKSSHRLKHTLLRYMASKGYKKDKEHLDKLSDREIKAIERGITNHYYLKWPGIFVRVHQTMMGIYIYRVSDNPMWSTLTQRIELWQAAFDAFKKKPVIGWGTGDVFIAMVYGFEKNDSYMLRLRQADGVTPNILKPHNQYLLLLMTHGIIGLALFLGLYIYTVKKTNAYKILHFKMFLIILAINLFANNQLEGQIGQSIFVFFTLFFCFIYPQKESLDNSSTQNKIPNK